MKISTVFRLVIVVSGFALLNACGSCSEAPVGNSNTASNGSNTKIIKPQLASNAGNLPGNANTSTPRPYPGFENGKNPTMDNSKVKVIDTSKARIAPPSKKMPDNSEISTIGKSDGSFVETRRFLNHPQLEKLVRTLKSAKDIRVTVHLRNGKVIPIDQDKLKNYKTDSAASILKVAGVVTAAPKVNDTKTKVEKQPANPVIKSPVPRKN